MRMPVKGASTCGGHELSRETRAVVGKFTVENGEFLELTLQTELELSTDTVNSAL